jgi:hypothetical protein
MISSKEILKKKMPEKVMESNTCINTSLLRQISYLLICRCLLITTNTFAQNKRGSGRHLVFSFIAAY